MGGNGACQRNSAISFVRLFHHALAERDCTPLWIAFPVSTVSLDRIEDYGGRLRVLRPADALYRVAADAQPERRRSQRYRRSLSVRRLNRTGKFLYECASQTITKDAPREIAYLGAYDEDKRRIQDMIDMPEAQLSTLIAVVRQNRGKLSTRATRRRFPRLDRSRGRDSRTDRRRGLPSGRRRLQGG